MESTEIDGARALRIHVLPPRMSRWVLPATALLSSTPLIAVFDNPSMDNAWVGIAVPIVFTGVIFLVQRTDKNTPRHLTIAHDRLTYHDPIARNHGIQIEREVLPFDVIEELRAEQKTVTHRVMAASDQGSMSIADGIDEATATWLKDFILAAITKADKQ